MMVVMLETKSFRLEKPDWMAPLQTIVLYGNSLVVSTFGASLEGRPGLRLTRVEAGSPGADQQLEAIRPDIVIFDLAIERASFAVNLWKALPGLLLIGVTADRRELLVLSGRQQQASCVEDLLSIIQGEALRENESTIKTFDGGKNETNCLIQ